VGAGGIFDGRGLAACLAMGCSGVWVGTRRGSPAVTLWGRRCWLDGWKKMRNNDR